LFLDVIYSLCPAES